LKSTIALGAILLFVGLAAPAWATPPDSIALSIDSTGFLSVEIHHPVKQLGTEHYINKVTVALNGVTIITQSFKSQSSLEWQYVCYRVIDAKEGDKLTVTAGCSIFGKLSETLTVPALGG
jgi:hypothetical protein